MMKRELVKVNLYALEDCNVMISVPLGRCVIQACGVLVKVKDSKGWIVCSGPEFLFRASDVKTANSKTRFIELKEER